MNNRIKKCIIGAKYIDEINELNSLGIKTIPINYNPCLDEEINNHADIQIFNCLNGNLIADNAIAGEIELLLKSYKVIPCYDIKSPYPNDIKLNAAIIGNTIICNEKNISKHILSFALNKNFKIINTKQGYTKCNLCVISDNAVITEDEGLSSLLKNYQMDVLKIKPGYVHLSDNHHGFIGGAGCMVSKNELYFSGNISTHPDYKIINEFVNKYNIKLIFNRNRELNDFGGFIPIY